VKLYLAQHGDATPKSENPDCPLSDNGKVGIENMARFLDQANVDVSRIAHSGKKRALETANILAAALAPAGELELNENLHPLDLPAAIAEEIDQWQDDVMLVGHLPHMAKLATLLLIQHEVPVIVSFTPGTLICLEKSADGSWLLRWMLSPEMLPNDR